ncbi:hypothetical protein [Dictyobacter aurantiacus]|uniref:Uncharacterized protein n=1 Tax=Dictyobacter aurantiacus TaxID=1936993 RepID=A0A401ZHJ3_9CHLR|nr:hypothetical protein [Dictyobacter aurantiacus]GCE06350.1 hypothetical protein KDAU_36790 [Dictyobacter aurantiacus]
MYTVPILVFAALIIVALVIRLATGYRWTRFNTYMGLPLSYVAPIMVFMVILFIERLKTNRLVMYRGISLLEIIVLIILMVIIILITEFTPKRNKGRRIIKKRKRNTKGLLDKIAKYFILYR